MNSYHKYTSPASIDAIRSGYTKALADIDRNTRRLTPEGLRIEKGRAYIEARDRMNALRDRFRADVNSTRSRLERQLYGANSTDPASIVAMRDAQDRAAKLTNDANAKAAWETAQWSGDTGLQKAIAAQASRRGWSETMAAHTTEHPTTKDLFHQLRTLPETEGVGETALFTLGKPQGFGQGDDNYIRSEVNQADQ